MNSWKPFIIVATAALASLLEIIDSSIVNVAIPTMMGNLGVTLDEVSWVTTGYMIANSIILPIAAWLGSRFGRRSYFTGAILIFTLSSVACGFAPNLSFLIFFRVIQGLAGGALLPTSQTLIQEAFPPEKAGMAMAIFGLSVMVGPALGPTLGGYLTDHYGWRSIFNVNFPLGMLASLMAWMHVEDVHFAGSTSSIAQKKQVDWVGLGLLCVGVGNFQYLLERGQTDGWFDATNIQVASTLAFTGIVSFIFWELKVEEPIMNLRLFKHSILRAGTMLMLALGIILYSLTFAIPIFVTNMIPQMSATQTGLLFMPGAVLTGLFMFPVGLLLKRVKPRYLVLVGLTVAEVAIYSLTKMTSHSGADDILMSLFIRGGAMAFLFVPINQMVLGAFRGEELGQVAGMQNFFRQMGGSIGIAALDTLLVRFQAQNYQDLLANINPLNPTAYQDYSRALNFAQAHLSSQVGLSSNPEILAVKTLMGRVQIQVFILSFTQLCAVIAGIVALGLIPLYLIRPKNPPGTEMLHAH